MGGILKDRWSTPSVAVAYEFIDGYMASANGEYVKVYLYVLRHQGDFLTIERIADALNHTESDVRRALLYWEKQGVLVRGGGMGSQSGPVQERGLGSQSAQLQERGLGSQSAQLQERGMALQSAQPQERGMGSQPAQPQERGMGSQSAPAEERGMSAGTMEAGNRDRLDGSLREFDLKLQAIREQTMGAGDSLDQSAVTYQYGNPKTGKQSRPGPAAEVREKDGSGRGPAGGPTMEAREARDMPVYSAEQVNRLSQDEEFSQLLYIAQKYMDRVFTPRDCQVFAYLYEDLGMSGELLEYLVEYCVQNGHTSVRYIEAVARNWHERDIRTAQEAKDYSASYNKDSFAVMKAFGLNSRKPAAQEQKLMDKWFKDYGFTREMVLEACNRTIGAIHNPSFQYADKILSEWNKSGIRTMGDIKTMDTKRLADKELNAQAREKRLQKYDAGVNGQGSQRRKGSGNQFHNFEQRDTDYDALMLKQVQEWVGHPGQM